MIKFGARQISKLVARSPKALFAAQEAWLRIGYNLLDLRAASWVIRRPEWLKQKPRSSPAMIEPARAVDGAPNVAIAKRCISMYQRAGGNEADVLIPEESMWGTLRQSHYAQFRSVVESGDVDALAKYQSHLFRTDTVNGYTFGTTFDTWPHRWHYLPVQIELSVVTLAESLGLLRAECHEQGTGAFWRHLYTEEQLMDRLEKHFEFRIEQPRFGDPRGILFGGRFLTRETCSHLYSAYRMRDAINRKGSRGPLRIVEIGGGFGGTCYWLRKLLGDRVERYAIVDLPEVGMVQAFFLGSAEPENLVLQGEPVTGPSPLQLLPHFRLTDIDFRPNVFINQDSMPEMPESEVVRYLSWASENVDGLFLSFNQETYAPWEGVHQVFVPEIISRYPRFSRLSRETSWDRRGYVEEIYHTV